VKPFSYLLIILLLQYAGISQTKYQHDLDSLHVLFAASKADSIKLNLLIQILVIHDRHKPEEGLSYKSEALALAERVNSKTGIAKVNHGIGRIFWRIGKFDSAYGYHFKALRLFEETGDKVSRNRVMVEIGQDYINANRYVEAEKYLLQAEKNCKASGDTKNLAYTYNIMLALYEAKGDYANGSKAAFSELKVCEEAGDKKGRAWALQSVANSFENLGNYTEASRYYRMSLQQAREIDDPLLQTYNYSSLGNIEVLQNDYTKAEKSYKEALKVANGMENAWIVGWVLNSNMGKVYRLSGRYEESLNYYLKTADDLRATANNHPLAILYADIGVVYTKLNQFDLAKKYLDSSMALCKKLDTKVPLGDYFNGMQLLDSATGDWKNAYFHYKDYVDIKDSAFGKETLRKMVASQLQYENEKKEAVAKAELQRQENIRNSVIVLLGAVLLFSIIAFVQRNKIAKEKKRSDRLLQDKELLLREIHHRVKNNLEVVSSLLALQSAQIDDPGTKEAMQEGQSRVHSIGIVHQKLYQGENLGTIEMKDYFINLSESILDSYGAQDRIRIEVHMEPLNIDIDTAVPLGLIVNELLTNTLKYAFPHKQQGLVRINLKKEPGILHLAVCDNGVGKTGVTHGTGFGNQLISLLTRQLNGTMKEEIDNGTRVYFDFKQDKLA
jgi:two-component sensor histidine kinase